jgi:hypothetical protein
MPSNNKDYKKEWFDKAEIDYFSPFVNLWLACNSWYNFHYGEHTDRANIDKLKNQFSGSNKIYQKFKDVYSMGNSKDEKTFLSLIELLHFSSVRAQIKPAKFLAGKFLGFEHLLVDFSSKESAAGYRDALMRDALTKTGEFKSGLDGVILNNSLVMTNDHAVIFSGLIEMLYQIRCALVHGELSPSKENHEVVKYCYLVLYELLKDFCGSS